MRSDVRPSIGSGFGCPAGSTASGRRHLDDRQLLRLLGSPAPRDRPACLAMPNAMCTPGRRRSASISSTRFWYDSLNVSARFDGRQRLALVGQRAGDRSRVEMPRSSCAWCSVAASRRYCSTATGWQLRVDDQLLAVRRHELQQGLPRSRAPRAVWPVRALGQRRPSSRRAAATASAVPPRRPVAASTVGVRRSGRSPAPARRPSSSRRRFGS